MDTGAEVAVPESAPAQDRALRRRLWREWALWLLVLLVIVGVQAWQLRVAHERIGHDQEARLRQQAALLGETLERQFVAIDAGLRSVVADLPGWRARHDEGSVQARLKALDAAIVGTRTLAVIGEDGHVLAASRPELDGVDVTAQPYYAEARADNQAGYLVVAAPYRTRLGVWSLNLIRVLQYADGGFAGMVVATIDPDWLAVTVRSINYAADMWSGLTHTGGSLLFLTPAPRPGLEGANLARPGSMFSRHVASGLAETLLQGTIAVSGQADRVIVQRTLTPAGLPMKGSLVIGTSRSLDGMYAGWREQVAAAVVLTSLLAALTAGGLALIQRSALKRARAAREAEQALRASEARWVLALESSGLGVWEFDPRSGVAFQSPQWKRLLGYADADLPPALESWRNLLHPDDREPTLQHLQQYLRGELPEYRAEFRLRCADGSWRWMASAGRVVARDAQGQPTRVVGTMRDIQARHDAEALRIENQLMQATLAVKTRFLSQMNHEIRTPLNAILGFGDIVRARLAQRRQDDLLPFMDHVLGGGRLLLDMASDMLEYTRLDGGPAALNVQAVGLSALIEAAVDKAGAAARDRGVSCVIESMPVDAQVLADPSRLRRALESLLDNAVTYNREGGEVHIRCEPQSGTPPAWRILIVDTGCGMSAEEMQHLFEPLYRGRHAGSAVLGSGLGLTLARWYLQRMGGTLTVASEVGLGTQVAVTLPSA